MTERHTESNSIHVHNTTPNTSLQTYTHAELPAVLNKSIQEALNFCVAAQLKYKTTKIQLNSHLLKKHHTPHVTRHTGARKPITCCTQHSCNWCHDVPRQTGVWWGNKGQAEIFYILVFCLFPHFFTVS